MDFEFDFLPLFIILFVAWLVPMAMSALGMSRTPTVVIEIIAGILIGPFVLDIVQHKEYIDFLALTGFIFLMFLSGLEIDVDAMVATLPRKRITPSKFISNPLLSGILIYVLTLFLGFICSLTLAKLSPDIQNFWYFALVMSTSSVGIILPVLKDRGESNLRVGQFIIISAAIADLLSIVLFTFTASYYRNGFDYRILLIGVLIIAFVISYFTGRKMMNNTLLKRIVFQLSHAASQIRVRGTIWLITAFVVLAQFVGAEIILGAFLAGLIMSIFLRKQRSSLILKLEGMGYGFFIPIFFVVVGIKLNFGFFKDFGSSFLILIALLFFLYLVKVLPSLIWSRILGFKTSITSGVLLSSRLSLIIAAAEIGKQLDIVSSQMNAVIVVAAIFTCFISPFIYSHTHPKLRSKTFHTLIVGGSSAAVLLARRLKMHGIPVTIIENNKDRYQDIINKGMDAINEDGTKAEVYRKLELKPIHHVVVLTGSYNRNFMICNMLSSELHHEKIITRLTKELAKCFVNTNIVVLDQLSINATALENMILRPSVYHALMENFESYAVEEIKINNKGMDGMQVKDIPFHQDGNLMIIKRKERLLVPHGDTFLRYGDIVSVVGNEQALEDFRAKLS